MLLKIAGISRSVYYYYINKKDIDEKNKDIIEKIREIYYTNKGRYGYRRVTLELKNQGLNINHKKVQRLMKKFNLQSIIRKKRKYSSYRGQIGKIVDNHIRRDFEAAAPNQKWFTDVTEFNLRGEKLYLSPILDAYGRYIVSYDISRSPNLDQINQMLNLAFKENGNYENLIFHSDQGWQYQHTRTPPPQDAGPPRWRDPRPTSPSTPRPRGALPLPCQPPSITFRVPAAP